ncbi:hypothetical protein LWI28_003337 [Acer negundo]|uniref:Uncharacterized protein n=1 Tax=Acer negundo TaxID=4023 RepID=A0AAD5ILW6_ACENE|nr:hypothetical protein LWI28_003337 [Acer negundo]
MDAVPRLTPTAYELQQDYMVGFNSDRVMGKGVARDAPDTLADKCTESESDKELLAERLNREMRLKHDHDRREKQTHTVYPQPLNFHTIDHLQLLLLTRVYEMHNIHSGPTGLQAIMTVVIWLMGIVPQIMLFTVMIPPMQPQKFTGPWTATYSRVTYTIYRGGTWGWSTH